MIKLKNGKKVMIDHWCLQPRPDGKRGRYGILPIYGYKRKVCIVDCILEKYILLLPEGLNYRIKAKHSDIMEYDENNLTLDSIGNTMYEVSSTNSSKK